MGYTENLYLTKYLPELSPVTRATWPKCTDKETGCSTDKEIELLMDSNPDLTQS